MCHGHGPKNNYTLLLRPHPNSRKWNTEVLRQLFADVKNVQLIDSKTTNEQLLKLDISAVLTVYGTVGSERPLVGVPVINASTNHKHCRIAENLPLHQEKSISRFWTTLTTGHLLSKMNQMAEYISKREFL